MIKLGLILVVIALTFGSIMDCDSPSGSMDMSGSKFQSIDAANFGKGLNAKICPVTGKTIRPGQGVEASLSNGKKIMMCCPNCKESIEKDPKKYASLMY
jgi:hypothetical protein